MNAELLIDMFYAAPELWYVIALAFFIILGFLFYIAIGLVRLRQKYYFLNRDRERYAETLYASKDGYFAFIYPDTRVNDPRKDIFERCSRRLAVMLGLENGVNSNFQDILKKFYKEDAKKIQKYVSLLKEEGVSFEDEFMIKNNERQLMLSGTRINGIDGNIYCDMIWFRDISLEAKTIVDLKKEKESYKSKLAQLEDMIDNIAYPVWLRDEKLRIQMVNKKYLEFAEQVSKEEIVKNGIEIINSSGDSISKNLAFVAISANKPKKQTVNIIRGGERCSFEVIETPFYADNNMDRICTVGELVDITEIDRIKRNLKLHQSAHLEILSVLDTAFAVFDADHKLFFYNKAYSNLWKLDEVMLEGQPKYSTVLDAIRSKRMLPEVPDFVLYKKDEEKDFSKIIEPKEDLLHLPDGKTFRRIRAPHPMGGLIFAYEDVSDKLATRRAYNSLLMVRKELLDNMSEAILIFASDGRLKFFNKAYMKLWKVQKASLIKEPSIADIIDSQRKFFDAIEDWKSLKEDILKHITNIETKTFVLRRNDGLDIDVSSVALSDESILVTYREKLTQ